MRHRSIEFTKADRREKAFGIVVALGEMDDARNFHPPFEVHEFLIIFSLNITDLINA